MGSLKIQLSNNKLNKLIETHFDSELIEKDNVKSCRTKCGIEKMKNRPMFSFPCEDKYEKLK